jgi:hypothetical protein
VSYLDNKGMEKIKEHDEFKHEDKLKTTDFTLLTNEDQILQVYLSKCSM